MNSAPLRGGFAALLIGWLATAPLLALYKITTGSDPALAWLGAGLAAVAPLSWFGLGLMVRAKNQEFQPLGFTLASGLGVGISMSTAWRFGPAADSALLVAGGALIAWVIYLRWVRRRPNSVTSEDSST